MFFRPAFTRFFIGVFKTGKTISFLSYSIENIPAGWRASETYQIQNTDEFIEFFELALPGKDFQVYSEGTLRRKK